MDDDDPPNSGPRAEASAFYRGQRDRQNIASFSGGNPFMNWPARVRAAWLNGFNAPPNAHPEDPPPTRTVVSR